MLLSPFLKLYYPPKTCKITVFIILVQIEAGVWGVGCGSLDTLSYEGVLVWRTTRASFEALFSAAICISLIQLFFMILIAERYSYQDLEQSMTLNLHAGHGRTR
jgi:hypothetical protein